MSISWRYTSADLESLPHVEGNRYEIIDGELHLSTQPDWHHQYVAVRVSMALETWNQQTDAGVAITAPGLIFAKDQDVAPEYRIRTHRSRPAAASLQPASRWPALPEPTRR